MDKQLQSVFLQLFPHHLLRQLHIDRGCLQVCVAQHFLYRPHGSALGDVMRGESMPKGVGAGSFDARLIKILPDNVLELLHSCHESQVVANLRHDNL